MWVGHKIVIQFFDFFTKGTFQLWYFKSRRIKKFILSVLTPCIYISFERNCLKCAVPYCIDSFTA